MAPASPDSPRYSVDDVQQILQIALGQQADDDHLSHQQLQDIADELGISADALTAAQQEWASQRESLADHERFNRQRKARLHHGLARFGIVGAGLTLLTASTGMGLNALLYLVLGPWGLKLTWDAWRVYQPNSYGYQREFQRWQRRQQMGQAVNNVFRKLTSS